jgi:hypothetical protein
MNAKHRHFLRVIIQFSCISLWLALAAPQPSYAKPHHKTFELGPAGVGVDQPGGVLIATSLNNISLRNAVRVKVDSIHLDSAQLVSAVPLNVGEVDAGQGAVLQANFKSNKLLPGHSYKLVVRGTYRLMHKHKDDDDDKHHDRDKAKNDERKPKHDDESDRRKERDEDEKYDRDDDEHRRFTAYTDVVVPPTAPGSATLGTAQVPPNKVTGAPYPAQVPEMDDDVNNGAHPVPAGVFVPGTGTVTPVFTGVTPSPVSGGPRAAVMNAAAPAIVFNANSRVSLSTAGTGCSGDAAAVCAEPSGASGGGVVFATANWFAAYSTDGGASFTQLNPTTIFPNDAVGFCCDQIVQYLPTIDRFVWLLQGTGYRMAIASPADIISSKGTAWTYWNLTPNVFGGCASFDYPDMSVGNGQLYVSWDAQSPGCTQGFQVMRTSLSGLQAAGTITVEFTDPANAPSSMIWGEHLTQNTADEIFWAGHNVNNKLRVYSLLEGSNTYFWRDTNISSWANNAPTSTSPDGQDWLAKNFNGPGGNTFPRNGIIGATRVGPILWFAWSAGTDSNFKQAHIEMVSLDRSNNFNKTQQVQVWNPDYAFAYPALATNACTGEVGMSFEFGGGGNYENHVVGFWGDFVAYIMSSSDLGTDRYGDYVSIRQAPLTNDNPGNLMTAFGWGVNKAVAPATGARSDVRYVLFGRPSSSCSIIK